MKLTLLSLLILITLSAGAQDKPRVYVQGKGSENVSSNGGAGGGHHWAAWGSKSTIDSHDESMEVTKDLQKNCTGVTVTINQANADYIVMLNRESKQNRGLLRSNNQLQVANKAGDILGSNATRTVNNASKDACSMIVADWQAHGRLNTQETAPAPAPQTPSVQPALLTTTPAVQATPAVATPMAAQPSQVSVQISSPSDGVAAAAKREKQHKACLELAKDNPSITCK
jgi:hypothetical protein